MTIGIVGLGLMGGSMAKSIKARTSHRVLGCDLDPETMMLARISGAIDGALTEENIQDCDLILLAVRPGAAVAWAEEHGGHMSKNAILVDLCGVKRKVCREIKPIAAQQGFAYIGGHPMAGSERGGFVNSTATLYEGASMILTPDERTDMRLLETLNDFFTDIGFASLTFSNQEVNQMFIADRANPVLFRERFAFLPELPLQIGILRQQSVELPHILLRHLTTPLSG